MSMSERVGLLMGVDRDPQQGRRSVDVSSWRSAFYALVVTALATIEAAGQEQPRSPGNADTPGMKRLVESGITEKQLQRWMDAMDDDEFATRQGATKEATEELWKAFDTEGDDERALFRRLEKNKRGESRIVSKEQWARMKDLKCEIDGWQNLPGALKRQGVIRGDAALHMVRQRAAIAITTDDETLAPLSATDVDLSGERDTRSINRVLAQICMATKSKPTLLPNGDIRLTPLEGNETVLSSKDLIGVLSYDAEGSPEKLSLQMEPGHGALLALFDRKGAFGPSVGRTDYGIDLEGEKERIMAGQGLPMSIAENGRPAWKGPEQKQVYRAMDAFHTGKAYAMVAVDPVQETIPLDAPATTVGLQNIRTTSTEQLPSGDWQLTVNSCVCGDVPWPPTPFAWDVLTYSLAHANRYVAKDEEGTEMHATVVETSFNMRTMTAQLAFPRKPASLIVRAYASMDARALDLPTFMPPEPRK